jgi:hypothetical protein
MIARVEVYKVRTDESGSPSHDQLQPFSTWCHVTAGFNIIGSRVSYRTSIDCSHPHKDSSASQDV